MISSPLGLIPTDFSPIHAITIFFGEGTNLLPARSPQTIKKWTLILILTFFRDSAQPQPQPQPQPKPNSKLKSQPSGNVQHVNKVHEIPHSTSPNRSIQGLITHKLCYVTHCDSWLYLLPALLSWQAYFPSYRYLCRQILPLRSGNE